MPILAAVLLTLTPPPADSRPADDGADSIIVTGEVPTHEAIRERALEFVRRTGVAELRPIARWIAPICPRAMGVADDLAAIVDDRVRTVAKAAGAPVGRPGCATNIVIAFTGDGGAMVRRLLDKAPRSLTEMTPESRDRAMNGDDAIRWWYTTTLQSSDGAPASRAALPWVGGGESGAPMVGGGLTQYNSSLIRSQAVRALRTATVIVDVKRAKGHSLDALASFAAMVAMAEMDADPPPPDNSILGLFDDPTSGEALTRPDAALLRAIYSVPPDREAHQHRRQLVAAIVDNVESAATE